jgi:hypothetical protein
MVTAYYLGFSVEAGRAAANDAWPVRRRGL